MNFQLTLRYALELSLLLPVTVFAFMPVTGYLRAKSFLIYGTAGVIMAICILGGAYFGVYHRVRIRAVMIPSGIIIFLLYMLAVDAEIGKKLFCFLNAAMLCVICPMYTMLLAGPLEILNFSGVFVITSCLMSLGLSVVIGLIFFKTLTVKLPMLLSEDRIKDAWRYMFLLPLAMSLLIYWMTPISPRVVMTGRVRPISLVLVLTLPAVIFLHIFWWTASRIAERARLQQENDLLRMESKRYSELKGYMNATREMRHDFRQHIFVMSGLMSSGNIDELREYLSQLVEKAGQGYKSFCANSAVDAVASHYDRIASSQGTEISWRLELPPVFPMKELDYCAMLGNLVENALKAVKDIPAEKRKVKVISSMLSDVMLGLSIDNPFEGDIVFGRDGLPVSSHEGHGTGLISVMNTVNHYGGTMNISASDNTFSVDIILYCTA